MLGIDALVHTIGLALAKNIDTNDPQALSGLFDLNSVSVKDARIDSMVSSLY